MASELKYSAANGTSGVLCFKGMTPVEGHFSDGRRTTTFNVVVTEKGDVSWAAVGKSRSPAATDVLDALSTELLTGVKPAQGKVWSEKNNAGVTYSCIRLNGQKHSLAVDANGKLSIRGMDNIPIEALARLVTELQVPTQVH